MAFNLKKMSHEELVIEMEKAALKETGVPLKFVFELASDGNLDLFRIDEHKFTISEIERMVVIEWFDSYILEELREFDEDEIKEFEPFNWHEETLGQPHTLFQFILEKTFGENAEIAGVEEWDECVMLNVAIPNK